MAFLPRRELEWRGGSSPAFPEKMEDFYLARALPRIVVLVFCLALGGFRPASAQTRNPALSADASSQPDPIKLGKPYLPLDGPWKFRAGDSPLDPATGAPLWAEADFNDAQWESVSLKPKADAHDPLGGQAGYLPGWTARGHAGYWGYAWYRLRVRVQITPGEKLAVEGPSDVDDAYQLFANGRLLGSFGDFTSRQPVVYYALPMIFPLPDSAASAADSAPSIVLAFRVWMGPSELLTQPDAGGLHTAPLIGSAEVVDAQHQVLWLHLIRTFALCPIEAYQFILLALASFSLILIDRSDRAYLWMGFVYLLSAADLLVVVINTWTQSLSGYAGIEIRHFFLNPLSYAAWAMVWWVWFRLRRLAWMPMAIAVLAVALAVSNAIGDNLFFTAIPQPVSLTFHSVSLVVRLIWMCLLLWIGIEGIREQGMEGWLTLPALLLLGLSRFQNELAVLHIKAFWFPLGTQVSLGDLAVFLLTLVVALLLLRRMLSAIARQQNLALDVRQAQEVQKVIMPQARVQYAGLEIETEFRPASEVSGDFFQIIPHPTDGSLLMVAGDVTGKGLQAGMLVALLVGAIRSTVLFDPDPLAVLKALNLLLCDRGHSNATCLAMRVDADGGVLLVNAGHLPPYVNGRLLTIDGALPLGIYAGAEPSLMRFALKNEDRLLLVSDGVVEARNSKGELFGFDRLQALLQAQPSAAAVADAAQSFGQDDDITVIAITKK